VLLQVRQQGVYSRLHRYLLTEGLNHICLERFFSSAITFPSDQSRDWCNIWRPLARSFNKLSIEFSRVNSM
jgi:hypothetical protein